MPIAIDLPGRRAVAGAVIACLLGACARVGPVPSPAPGPSAPVEHVGEAEPGEPYAGLSFDDDARGGARVAATAAGPAALAGLEPGDRIVRVGGLPADPGVLRSRIASSRPGEVLALAVDRGEGVFEVAVVIGRRADWLGPADWPVSLPAPALPADETQGWYDDALAAVEAIVPDVRDIDDDLSGMFAALAADTAGYNKLPVVRAALTSPQVLIAREQRLMRALRALSDGHRDAVPLFCELLAVDCAHRRAQVAAGKRDFDAFVGAVGEANASVARAFSGVAPGRAALAADLRYLVEQTAAGRLIHAQADAPRALRAMRASMAVGFADLVTALEALLANAYEAPAPGPGDDVPGLPDGVVTGTVRAWAELGDGFVIVGGDGANRYDMDLIDAVIDAGGDDVYVWRAAAQRATQTIVDRGGNDRYEASYGGPGAGWLGVAVLIDHAGDDVYRSVFAGCGAGAFGFGVLIDGAGSDTYRCDAWSLGAGLYGGGLVIDAGRGSDAYLSQILSQGVGGPRGAGLLIDAGGDDLYRANGLVPSAYDTPAVFAAFSQGVGFGLRPHDHGGIGALFDGAGDDRFEGGEFSQGGGYFWGLGLLHDAGGDDLYYGNRYAQGFAAHQSAGMLSDLAGDDVYWSMTAAAQGAAWDQSVALLHDAGGDDRYRASALSQGAAAHQSRAWLYDAGGDDVYRAGAGRAQGTAGANDYHFDAAAAIYSFGVMFDRAGRDAYSSGLANGEARMQEGTGEGGEGRAGVAIDRP